MTDRFDSLGMKILLDVISGGAGDVEETEVFKDLRKRQAGKISKALREAAAEARAEETKECAMVAEMHHKNCSACGCDGWQIAESIRARSKAEEG